MSIEALDLLARLLTDASKAVYKVYYYVSVTQVALQVLTNKQYATCGDNEFDSYFMNTLSRTALSPYSIARIMEMGYDVNFGNVEVMYNVYANAQQYITLMAKSHTELGKVMNNKVYSKLRTLENMCAIIYDKKSSEIDKFIKTKYKASKDSNLSIAIAVPTISNDNPIVNTRDTLDAMYVHGATL